MSSLSISAFLNFAFAPLLTFEPVISILIFSFLFSVLAIVLNLLLIKKSVRDELKQKMDYYQKKTKEVQQTKDLKQIQEIQKQQLDVHMKHFRESMKPTIVLLVLFYVIFTWLESTFKGTQVFLYPFGFDIGLIWWYALVAITSAIILRKIFDIR